ncbi:MAG: TSCPD domain-containing protein [Cetobacterium sp.]
MNKLAILLAGTAILSQTSLAEIKKDVKFTEEPHGVCSTLMTVEVKEGKIESFKAARGCPGNLNAISKLLPGMEVTKVIELLDDNECSGAQMPGVTSCMDNMF